MIMLLLLGPGWQDPERFRHHDHSDLRKGRARMPRTVVAYDFPRLGSPAAKHHSADRAAYSANASPGEASAARPLTCMILSDARALTHDGCVLLGRSPRPASG